MTTDSDGNAYWGNRNYISEDSISISSKADIDSSVTISSNDIILSDTGDKLTISLGIYNLKMEFRLVQIKIPYGVEQII